MFQSLRSKLVLILAAAVLPAIIVSGLLAFQSYRAARDQAGSMFHQNSRIIVNRLQAVLLSAGRVATAHAQDRDLASGSALACGQKLQRMIPIYGIYAGLAVISQSGVVCEAGPHRLSAQQIKDILGRLDGQTMTFGWLGRAEQSGAFWAGAPTEMIGERRAVVVIVDEPVIAATIASLDTTSGTAVALWVDHDGSVISLNGMLDSVTVQRVIAANHHGEGVVELSTQSQPHVFAVHHIDPLGLHLIVGAPRSQILQAAERQLLLALLAPLTLLFFAVMTIWLGLDKLVLRWILRLRQTASDYASGNLEARCGDVAGAPMEFRQFCESFDRMADSVAERTHQLEDENAEKKRYIRELHHRVKNNLQVIASLLALQKRSLPDEQKAILRFPEDRVNAMSAAYRVAYAHSEAGRVDIAVMLHEVVSRLETAVSTGRAIVSMEFDTQGQQVDLDTAIPIAMLLAEIVPTIFDRAASAAQPVALSAGIGGSNLMIEITGRPIEPDVTEGLSRRFVSAYLRQLSASYEVEEGAAIRIQVPLKGHVTTPESREPHPL